MNNALLRAYPRAWRERYGDELAHLIEADSGGGRIALRVKLDVIGAGLIQRLRSSGLAGDEVPPEGRIRAGVLLVLSSWAAFVVAGLAFAKTAEHWQALTPRPDRGTPAAAYDAVVLAAGLGTLLVLLGLVLVAGPLHAFLRDGGWQMIHRPLLRALASTGLTFVVLVAVVVWAHRLTDAERNGGNRLYGVAFVALAVCGVGSIALWTHAAVATARQLALTRASLYRETFLAAATTLAMAVMTVAAAIWWAFVYGASPVRMVAMTLVMLGATALAATGTVRSVRALWT
ncbi:MAG TPA: hypothetical protein VH108_07110 [Gaiellaceae bacterium]|nr:hypothetical protein [Gaiellaceae bacterium]